MAEFHNSIGSLDGKWHVSLMIASSLLAISVLGPGWYSEDVLVPYHWHYSFFSWSSIKIFINGYSGIIQPKICEAAHP